MLKSEKALASRAFSAWHFQLAHRLAHQQTSVFLAHLLEFIKKMRLTQAQLIARVYYI